MTVVVTGSGVPDLAAHFPILISFAPTARQMMPARNEKNSAGPTIASRRLGISNVMRCDAMARSPSGKMSRPPRQKKTKLSRRFDGFEAELRARPVDCDLFSLDMRSDV